MHVIFTFICLTYFVCSMIIQSMKVIYFNQDFILYFIILQSKCIVWDQNYNSYVNLITLNVT